MWDRISSVTNCTLVDILVVLNANIEYPLGGRIIGRSCEIYLWMPDNTFNDKSETVVVMSGAVK